MDIAADDNLLAEFSTECQEHLRAIGPEIQTLAASGGTAGSNVVNRIFLAVHSIGGSAGFLGLTAITSLTQGMETVLTRVRDRELELTPAGLGVLVSSADRLVQMLAAPRASAQVPFEDQLAGLKALIAGPQKARTSEATREESRISASTNPAVDSIPPRTAAETQVRPTVLPPLPLMPKVVSSPVVPPGPPASSRGPGPDPLARPCQDKTGEINGPSGHAAPPSIPDRNLISTPPQASPAAAPTTPEPPETKFAPDAPRAVLPETIRVGVRLIEQMMNLAGELVLGRNQLRRMLDDAMERSPILGGVLQRVDLVTSDLQEQIMHLRMQPVGNVLGKFPRMVKDLSRQLAKEVDLNIEGGEVELDKSILEALSDPLTHLIRNCLDHGLEPPEKRSQLGKPRAGRVDIQAFHEEGQVNIIVSDDGWGMDPERIARKAISSGLMDEAMVSRMSDADKLAIIFLPGFSTARTVTDVSGRGVGMDVVRTNIEQIGGRLEIDSQLGRGTMVRLRLPLTLAIVPSLVVEVGRQSFAVPQVDVQELVCVQVQDIPRRIETVGEATVLRLRGRLLPLVRLADILDLTPTFLDFQTLSREPDRRHRLADRRASKPPQKRESTGSRPPSAGRRRLRTSDVFVVVLKSGVNRFGLIVDELLNTEEIVVKPLSSHLKDCRAYSGATIMGDGRVAMILNSVGLAALANLRFGEVDAEERRRQERERRHGTRTGPSRPVVVFTNALAERFALPLGAVARLEKIDPRSVVRLGGREYITYRETGLPLLRLEDFLPVAPLPKDLEEIYLIVPRTKNSPLGIMASGIVDVIEIKGDLQPDRNQRAGVLGTAVVDGYLTTFIEPTELIGARATKRPPTTGNRAT